MSYKIKITIFSIFFAFAVVVFFYMTGCCSKGGGGSGFVAGSVGGGHQPEPKPFDVKVEDDGSIKKQQAPSGRLSIEAGKGTLNKNVVVHMIENQAVGNESDIYSVGTYIYSIKPDREETNEVGISIGSNAKRDVKIQTNPIILTFSDDERLTGSENYYIGIKEIGGKDWQFVNVYSSTNPQINSNGPKGAFEYKLYKDNVYVALFADFNKNTKIKDKPKVLSMVASMPDNIIEILDGRYNEDAVIKLKFIGDNLSALRADDYRIRLHYSNSDPKQVNIRIDGKSADYISGTSTNKYAAFGELYAHYYEFVPTTASYSAGVTPELSFTLNFKKFPIGDFSSDFVVEASNATDRAIPFSLSDSLHFDMEEKKESKPEPKTEPVIATMSVVFSIASDSTHIFDTARNLYYLNPEFSVTASPSFAFTDEAKAIIASSVTLVEMSSLVRASTASSTEETGLAIMSDEELLKTEWNENSLIIGFRQKLATYTQYVVSMNALNGLVGVEATPFESFTFRTAGTVEVSIATDSTNLIDVENNLYHCRPLFSVNPGFTPNDKEKAAIASAVAVVGAEKSIVTKTWNNNLLNIGFSKNLAADTEYTVKINDLNSIERLCLKPFKPLKFKTTGDFYIALSPDVDNVFDTENSLYRCRPSFTIIPSTVLGEEDLAKIASAVTVVGIDEANIIRTWASGSLNISFSQDIEQNTEFTLSITELPEIKGKNFITFQPFVFKTMGALELAITPDVDNVYAAVSPLYHCRPGFTIAPSISLNEEDRAKIANAVSLSNVNSNQITKNWNDEGKLVIGFSQNLAPASEYTLSMSAVNNIKGVSVTAFNPLVFTTAGNLEFTLTPDTNNVYAAMEPKYRCNPSFTITPSFALNEEDKTKISNAVAINNGASAVKGWEGNNLKVSLSQNLAANTAYTISMANVNDINGINVVPFNAFNFDTVNNLTFTITPDDDNIYAAVSPKYQCRPGFTITPSFTLNEEDKTKIADAVSLSNSVNIASKTWEANNLRIFMTQNLATDTAYTLSMTAVNNIEGVGVTPFDSLNFSTLGALTFTVTPDDDNLFDVPNSLVHCKPGFTLAPAFALNEADKTKILNAVSVSDIDSSSLVKEWNNEGKLHIGFNTKLASGTDYSLNMATVDDVNGVVIPAFASVPFRTMNAINVTIVSEDSNIIDVPNNLYHCRPQFTITPDFEADDSAKEIIASAVTVLGVDENNITRNWVNGSLVIGFVNNLTTNTDYTISIGDIEVDIDKLAFKLFEPLTFTTTGDSYVSITPDDGNAFISTPQELYHCRPTFTITPSVALGDSDRATIAAAIHVSNVSDGNLTKNWNGSGSLILGFNQNLLHNTEYTVSIDAIGEIAGVNLVLFQPLTFKTVSALNLVLASSASNAFVSTPSVLYHCRPTFTLTPSLVLDTEDKAKIKAAIRVTNVNDANITREWDSFGNLLIGFNQNLNVNTNYTVSLAAVNDITGITVNPFTPFAFTTMGAVTFTVTPDAGNVYAAADPLYRCNPAFTITPNYTLSDANKTTIANAVSVIGSAVTSKAWDGNNLRVTFSSALTHNSDYTLAMAAVNSITGVTVNTFDSVAFTTVPALTFTLDSPDSNVFVSTPSELYHCRPVFTITPSFNLNEEDKTKIENAVTISGGSANMTKQWSGNVLEIGFSSDLSTSTNYTLSMNAVTSISGVSVTPMTSKNFKTIGGLNIAIASDSGDVFVIENGVGLYQTLPTFTVTSNMPLSAADQTRISNAISVSNVASNKIDKSWANATTLNISFTENLAHNTNYTISMADVDDISGVSVSGFSPLSFKTMNALAFTAADVDGNVFVTTPSELYQCRPSFTVTPNYTLNEENRTKIANAVTVSNANNITKNWNNNILTVSFSSDLALSSAHTLSMGAVNDITGVSVTPFANKSFTTIGAITFTATPDDSNVYTAMNPKYHCKPAFTITPNYSLAALSEASKTVLLDAVNISNSSGVTKAWDGNNIRVTCSTNLAANAHSLSMLEVDFTGITVTPFANLDFTVLDTLTFTVTPDAGNVYTALSPKYNCRPSYTITTSFTLNEEDKTKIKNAISVSNTESIIHKEWQGNSLVITFSENLTSDTAYTLQMENVSGMPNVNIINFSNQTFTTIPQLTFNITSANTNVFYDGKYHCNPTFTITPSFAVDSSYNSAIEGAVSVSGVNSSNLSKTWNGNNLTLGFNNYIATSTDYTISMSAINNLTGVNVTSLSNFDFSTIPDLIVSLATSTTTLVKKANSSTNVLEVNGKNYCYCSGSSFTISTNMTLDNANKAKLFDAISLTGINSSLVNKGWNEEKIAIGFNDTLPASTSYSIQMSAINDINGVTVKPFSTFTTTSFYHLGKGTEDNPFTIYTPAQLACLDLYPSEAYYYKQMEDLDLSVYDNWKPIGSSTESLRFYGIYDGNNKKISNATIFYPNVDYVGLFSYTDRSYNSNTSIKNLTLEDFTVNGKSGVGALAGHAFRCELNNISVIDSSITGDNRVGGIAGFAVSNYSKVLNVTTENVNVTGRNDVGGLFGYNQNNTKENCGVINSNITSTGGTCGGIFAYSTNYTEKSKDCFIRNSNIRAKGYCGGYVGLLTNNNLANYLFEGCSVENCRIFREDNGNYTGGFIGIDDSRLSAIYQSCNVASVTISSTGSYVGGFAGSFAGNSIDSCYVASITMDTNGNFIGGLIGSASGNITSCYTDKANITARSHSVGGLVGYQTENGVIEQSYVKKAKIEIDTPSDNRQCYGGLVGQSFGTINLCYVDQSDIDSFQQVGGLVGYCTSGSISKSFVKDTRVNAYNLCVGGLVGTVFPEVQIDSCYVKGNNISCTVEMNALNHGIGGLVASNSGDITNCYVYNSTVTGKTNYGALVGINGAASDDTTIANNFISPNYSILIDYNMNSALLTNCYYNVNDLATFNGKTWSAGAWSNFNTTSFPPQLTGLPEP